MFRAHVLIVRRAKLYYTVSGIITLKQVNSLKLLRCTFSKILKFKAAFVTIWGVHRWNSKWGPVQRVICHYFTRIILQKNVIQTHEIRKSQNIFIKTNADVSVFTEFKVAGVNFVKQAACTDRRVFIFPLFLVHKLRTRDLIWLETVTKAFLSKFYISNISSRGQMTLYVNRQLWSSYIFNIFRL